LVFSKPMINLLCGKSVIFLQGTVSRDSHCSIPLIQLQLNEAFIAAGCIPLIQLLLMR
jgi:hypothetical protein